MSSIPEIPEPISATTVVVESSWLGRIFGRLCDVIKQNLLPGLILQVFVMLVVGGYYLFSPVADLFNRIAQIKQAGGVFYAGASTAVFAGLIPFLIQKSRPKFRDQIPFGHIWFFLVFWFFMGMNFDVMMQVQAWLFGHEGNLQTMLCKTAADMLIYSPFCGLPMIAIALLWRQNGFNFSQTGRIIGQKKWWTEQFMSMLIANWTVWPVAIAAVYSLPLPLQIPVQNLIMCFWCILLIFMTDQTNS